MSSRYVPSESFESQKEIDLIKKILSNIVDALYDHVDESIEIWLIDNKDKMFLQKLDQTALSPYRIYDPFDELPINQHRRLLHIAVIYHY